jgi:hypothetical protein
MMGPADGIDVQGTEASRYDPRMRILLATIGLALLVAAVPMAADAAVCQPLPMPAGRVRTVRTADELQDAVRSARADSAIVLEDGTYELSGPLEIQAPGVTLRGRSADPTRTVIRGQGMGPDSVGVGLGVGAPRVTIAHLSIGLVKFHAIQVRGESGASQVRVYGVRLFDTGQQLLKGSFAPGERYADDGRVECSTFEYTDHAPSDYTNGVDLIGTKDWVIRDNRFFRIRGPRDRQWAAGPAVLVWGGSEGTIVERNVVVDCYRGIALGLGPGAFNAPRGGGQADHRGGVIRHNVVVNLNAWADEGIEVSAVPDVRIEFNTVLVEGQLSWSISVRFPLTSATVRNNLTSRRVLSRDGGRLAGEGNVEGATRDWFVDPVSGNLRLTGAATRAIDAGVPMGEITEDFDGGPRTAGPRPDAGAFEFRDQSPLKR